MSHKSPRAHQNHPSRSISFVPRPIISSKNEHLIATDIFVISTTISITHCFARIYIIVLSIYNVLHIKIGARIRAPKLHFLFFVFSLKYIASKQNDIQSNEHCSKNYQRKRGIHGSKLCKKHERESKHDSRKVLIYKVI